MSAAFWLDLGAAAGALLALGLLLSGGRHLRHRRVGRAFRHGFGGLLLGGLVALVLLVGIDLLTYARLTAERPVAMVSFRRLAPQRYAVVLVRTGGGTTRTTLDGDEWQLDARIIKWKGFATVLGLKPLYRLQRLSGRYESLEQAQNERPSVVGLARDRGISLWEVAHREAGWLPLVDASYGTATYLPMADGARFRVTMSATGLLARPANAAARSAVAGWE